MRVKAINWVGLNSFDFEKSKAFYENIIQLKLIYCDRFREFALFRLPSGQDIEVFGPNFKWTNFHTSPVLGFEVADIYGYRIHLEKKGIKFLTKIIKGEKWGFFCYFKGQEDRIFELVQRESQKQIINSPVNSYDSVILFSVNVHEETAFLENILNIRPIENDGRIVFHFPNNKKLQILPNKYLPNSNFNSKCIISFEMKSGKNVFKAIRNEKCIVNSETFPLSEKHFQKMIFFDPAKNLFQISNK